ncbi:centromere-associated protein E isoform X2 [Carassius gibelio]|uniref:centromere-associated protein E isoform X2 n=1 Tax=Carassius gibelio TaxID=101364 RepID=UPI00227815B5|nr:centromere-associated protein E isoform X2 [Carassius gibelio]
MTEESAVKVCVRVRPLIKREESESPEPVQLYWRADKQAIHQLDDDGAQTKSYSFDRVFSAEETTAQLYQDIAKPLVVSAVEGYNGTIFAYGQTSSGKTFTMMGSEHNRGVIPLAMADVFKTIKNCPKKEFLLRVSYMEIYNETVTDLLCESWKRKPLEIREGNYKNVYVADLTEELVTSPEQALSWITKGEKNRHYGKTKMNQRSSRSHTIFRMILESRERSDPASGENADGAIIVSHLNLVDLAGAERASQTGAEGARFKEGCNINRSLFTLGQVIKKLSDESQKGFLNYRDSKLTRILQNSLGGNAKTVIICTITPATVDETVSTLQFASAAKRMKNDPHVTEVSDEGALLRRYRNEIVDLKRRLQEVSSVTQTTATERESLCQLLQEKDQLQREQQDRIKNLTKLLVTASNVALIPKVPKRRVTWGGKLLTSARLLNEDFGASDMSFAEPYIKKRRADCSLPDEGEDMDEFDSRFDFTALEEPNMDMEMSSNTVRSSSEGSHYLDSPQASELTLKVVSLERQLEAETQCKQRAEEMSTELQLKISELQNKLDAQATLSEEKTISQLEKQMEALQSRLEEEVQDRQKAQEETSSLELKVAELAQTSEALLHSQHTCEQIKKDLEEAIQFCETLGFEKDAVIAERDSIKHALQLITEDLESLKADKDSLQKDKDALQKDVDERKDADEFEKLEQESKKEYERELEAENSKLQQDLQHSEDMIQKLKADLAMMSSELQKKTDLNTELQSCSDKDLVQEVTRLRRSLDDAECVSLDTKKEWAFLRTENISLKERDATLTAGYEKMEDEVKMLQDKLEQEKSRFKKMQTDLQKELMGAFDENTKLTALLDGKVPKNLTDNFVLEKTVCDLRKELDQSHETERCLQTKMEQMETLPVKVDELQRQVCELSEELRSVREERDTLISAQASVNEDHQRLKDEASKVQDQLLKMESDLVDAQLKEAELSQQLTETSERLQNIQTDLQHVTQEKSTLLTSLEEATQKSEQLSAELESVRGERDVLLSEKMEEVQRDPDEMEKLRHTISSITEEREQLQEILQGLREERDQLKSDMEENVEMMIETQAELRDAQEKVKELRGRLHDLESQRVQKVEHYEDQKNCIDGQLEKLQDQLTEELSAAVCENEPLLSESSNHQEQSDVMEKMKAEVTSLTQERDQLQERLRELETDNIHMRTRLEKKNEMILQAQAEEQQQHLNLEQEDSSENNSPLQQIQTLKEELETLLGQRNQLTLDLQETSQQVCDLSEELRSVREERDTLISAQASVNEDHQRLKDETSKVQDQLLKMESDLVDAQLKEAELSQQLTETSERLKNIQTDLQHVTQEKSTLLMSLEEATQKSEQLSAELESVRGERDVLLSEKMEEVQRDPDEMEKLRHTISSITEEREQLQEILQGLREERDQLKSDLEDTNGMLMQVQQEHSSSQTDTQHDELLQQMQQLQEELDTVNEERNQLKSDQQENVEMMIENQEELRGALEKVKDLQNTIRELESQQTLMETKLLDSENTCQQLQELQVQMKQLREEFESVCHERERLLSERSMNTLSETECMEQMKTSIRSLMEERDQLGQTLQDLRDEVEQLRREQQEREQMMVQLKSELQAVCAERDRVASERSGEMEKMSSVTEERDQLLETLQQLTDENTQLKRDQQQQDETLVQVREQFQSACTERDRLLSEKNNSDLENTMLEELQTSLASVTEEREQLLEILKVNREEKNQLRRDLEEKEETLLQLQEEIQSSSAEKEQLLSERTKEQQEKLAELKMANANIASLTQERDQLLETLQGMRNEREQLKRDQLEKSEMMVQLRQELQSACAERDRLTAERDAACNPSGSSSSMTSLSEGGDLQEILQGVRELIQVQGELKQKKHQVSDQMSPTGKQKALDQIQALTEEMESLRNQRVVLRKDLQEATAISKMYQDLLHVTKEELKQQQKENAELMERSAAKESQLQQQLSQISEDLSALRVQHNTEIQNLQSKLTSLTKVKDELQDTLKMTSEEGERLRQTLQNSEEMRNQLTGELESLTVMKDQLENKTCTEQVLESLRDVTKERDQLKQELEGKMEKLTRIETKADQLEKQKILLESEVHSLSQSLTEVNCSVSDQSNLQSKPRSGYLVPEIDVSDEKMQAAFVKLQEIIDRPTNTLSDVNREEWAVIFQLVPFIPKDQRMVHDKHTKKTTRLNHVLIKIAEAYRRLAQRYKTHFETEVQRDVASFEESRLQDLLMLMAQTPSQSFRSLQDDFQQLWDQRRSCLLERRQEYLQKLEAGLKVLEDGLAKHEVMVSEERQHRTRELEELRSLLRSPQAAAIVQLHERQIARRTKAAERLNAFYFALLNKCDSAISPLKLSSGESEQRLKDQRRETITLLQAQHGTLPKTETELLQDNQRLSLQLQQTQKQMEDIQEQMKKLKVQADTSNLQLQELCGQLKEKEALIQSLKDKLKESEVLAKRSMTPGAAELAALKDKLVKMELDHIAVTTSHENEIAQMSSMLEHRADVIRKLKETLRKMQQDDEQSFTDGGEFDIKLGSSTSAVTSLKEKMEELQKKNTQFEGLVSKQQEEINKWKRRAYKMKECKRDTPCTPTKRHPPLTETEVNSPKRTFLDSPKSKFFDVRSKVPIGLNHPTQFFDNSNLGTVPDVSHMPAEAIVDSSDSDDEDTSSSSATASDAAPVDDWWQIPNALPEKPDACTNANACPTQ